MEVIPKVCPLRGSSAILVTAIALSIPFQANAVESAGPTTTAGVAPADSGEEASAEKESALLDAFRKRHAVSAESVAELMRARTLRGDPKLGELTAWLELCERQLSMPREPQEEASWKADAWRTTAFDALWRDGAFAGLLSDANVSTQAIDAMKKEFATLVDAHCDRLRADPLFPSMKRSVPPDVSRRIAERFARSCQRMMRGATSKPLMVTREEWARSRVSHILKFAVPQLLYCASDEEIRHALRSSGGVEAWHFVSESSRGRWPLVGVIYKP